jgi:hypothetical protein
VAAGASGQTIWVVYNNWQVAVFDADGQFKGVWLAGTSLPRASGIATNETDIWILDFKKDQVRYYRDAASRLSGSQSPNSTFRLVAGDPSGITTDGMTVWVTDKGTDRVYQYTTAGVLLDDWPLHKANSWPEGITIDPTGSSNSVWVVDRGENAVYEYDRDTGEFLGSFALETADGNTGPSGIADPPQPKVAEALHETMSAQLFPDAQSAPYLHGSASSMLIADPPWRPREGSPNAIQLDRGVDSILPRGHEDDAESVREDWMLQLIPTIRTHRPAASQPIVAACLSDIVDEESEYLDEDLLALIAAAQE